MIQIDDNDMPITVAEKLIHATRSYKPTSPLEKAITKAVTGDENAMRTVDMFDENELREIIGYIEVYLKHND